jgi:hypothetical protein
MATEIQNTKILSLVEVIQKRRQDFSIKLITINFKANGITNNTKKGKKMSSDDQIIEQEQKSQRLSTISVIRIIEQARFKAVEHKKV